MPPRKRAAEKGLGARKKNVSSHDDDDVSPRFVFVATAEPAHRAHDTSIPKKPDPYRKVRSREKEREREREREREMVLLGSCCGHAVGGNSGFGLSLSSRYSECVPFFPSSSLLEV